jgi:hypothetical protein
MFDAIARVDRSVMGFTFIKGDANIRIEWVHPKVDALFGLESKDYDAMLHVFGKTSRTVAFKRTGDGYEWIGEQETFEGPRKYGSVDGTFNETITVTYHRVPISGFQSTHSPSSTKARSPSLRDRGTSP